MTQACPHQKENAQACDSKNGVCPVKVYIANLAVWYAKLHNLHWNVVGGAFVQVHEFTESMYDEVTEQYDAVAEAVKMRRGMPPVRLTDYLGLATIEELDARDFPVAEVVKILYDDVVKMQTLAQQIRDGAEKHGDGLLVAQFDEYLAWYSKKVWFLSAMMAR